MYVKSYYKKSGGSGKGKWVFLAIIIIAVLVAVYFILSKMEEKQIEQQAEDRAETEQVIPQIEKPEEMTTILEDVTGSAGSGTATISYNDRQNETHHTVIAQLPPPDGDMFYEGWLVRQTPFEFFSTGAMVLREDEAWGLEWTGEGDLREFNQVVITIEPDDGDPAPADHILEGSF